jgi:hypothetical protein
MDDDSSWLFKWLINNPITSQSWLLREWDYKSEELVWVYQNYKTLGGTSGKGNRIGVRALEELPGVVPARSLFTAETEELANRITEAYNDANIGIEVDSQFFIDNEGWYLAKVPKKADELSLFYRGKNDNWGEVVVRCDLSRYEIEEELFCPPSNDDITEVNRMTFNDIDTDSIRWLNLEDSWILTGEIKLLNWQRFPSKFLK